MPKFLDHFGILAPFYERVIRPVESARLMRLLDPLPGQRLLDAGGGTGRVAQQWIGRGVQIVITDESMRMLEQARTKPGLQPLRAHTETLPFGAATFERILMVDALHHVANQQQTAAELVRILKPGGRLVIEEPNLDLPVIRILAVWEKLMLMRSRILNPRRMMDLFAGFPVRVRHEVEGGQVWVIIDKEERG